MKVEIGNFADSGNDQKERLILKVNVDVDIGGFAVFRARLSDSGEPLSGYKVAYWFPDKKIKAGDLVVLYTKSGTASQKLLSGDRTAHFFYWGLAQAIWASEKKNAAVICSIDAFGFKSPT